jgi:ABC-2 type transport system permease protein
MPPAVVQAFGLQEFGTPAGFLRGNLYELLVPLLYAIAAVALVNGQTASDESSGRLELYLAQPISRRVLFAARLVACLLALAVIVVVTLVAQLAADALVGLEIDTGFVVGTVVLCGLLGALFATFAYLIACLRPSPGLVLGLSLALLFAGYVVAALFPISDVLERWRAISPWDWAFAGDPLANGAEPWRIILLVGIGIVLAVVGTIAVRRRDIAAA